MEQSQLSENMRGGIKCAQDLMHSMMAQTIREAQQEGEVNEKLDPHKIAAFLFNASHGAAIQMQVEHSTEPYDNFVDIIFESILVP